MAGPNEIATSRLDRLDHAILAHLAEDGRRSNARIAAALGVSQWTVKNRIDRLLNSGACEVLAVVDPERLGYGMGALTGVQVEPGRAAAFERQLVELGEVDWVARTTGRFDVVVGTILPDSSGMFDLVVRRIARVPGVVSTDTFLILRQTRWKPMEWRPPEDSEHQSPGKRSTMPTWTGDGGAAGEARDEAPAKTAEQLDSLDTAIIALLQEDGRRPAAEIARAVNVSKSTVKTRIDRLVHRGVCKVVAVVNPRELGYRTETFVGIRTDPTRTDEIGDALARLPQVFWVCHLAGWYDILVDVWLRDGADIFPFLDEQIRPIPGVRSTEAFGILNATIWRPAEWRPTTSTWWRPAGDDTSAGTGRRPGRPREEAG